LPDKDSKALPGESRGATPKKRKVKQEVPRRRTVFWDATTHKEYERLMRAYLVALNVSQAGHDHIADVKRVDETAEAVIAKINKHRGLE
jgi:hypothetical protein